MSMELCKNAISHGFYSIFLYVVCTPRNVHQIEDINPHIFSSCIFVSLSLTGNVNIFVKGNTSFCIYIYTAITPILNFV